jgi:predicted branched-subunit amino acid permease
MPGGASFRRGLRDGAPIFVAVGALGIAFGVLALEAGLAGWIALLASVVVVSGAAQFALVGLAGAALTRRFPYGVIGCGSAAYWVVRLIG